MNVKITKRSVKISPEKGKEKTNIRFRKRRVMLMKR